MAFKDSMTKGVDSDNQINSHYKSLLDTYLNTMDSDGSDVEDIRHEKPAGGSVYEGPMKGSLMTWTQMLEAMDAVSDSIDHPAEPEDDSTDILDQPVETEPKVEEKPDEKELLDELDKLFTPVLVMQNFEKDIADQENAQLAESGFLTERNIIKFDDETRMSQLVAVCAKLIAKKKNTEAWQMYQKAATIKKQANMNIQKEEYEDAKALAQRYLVMVSTTNNSSVARNAANELLPQTNR